MSWVITNAVERNRDYPKTFYIPTQEERMNVKVGDSVKIILEDLENGERVWVSIISKDNDKFEGELVSHPTLFPIQYGERISFGEENIIDIRTKRLLDYRGEVIRVAMLIKNTYEPSDWLFAIAYECNKLAFQACLNDEDDPSVVFLQGQSPTCPGCIIRSLEIHVHDILRCGGTKIFEIDEQEFYDDHNCGKTTKFEEWRATYENERKEKKTWKDFLHPTLREFMRNSIARNQVSPLLAHIEED